MRKNQYVVRKGQDRNSGKFLELAAKRDFLHDALASVPEDDLSLRLRVQAKLREIDEKMLISLFGENPFRSKVIRVTGVDPTKVDLDKCNSESCCGGCKEKDPVQKNFVVADDFKEPEDRPAEYYVAPKEEQ